MKREKMNSAKRFTSIVLPLLSLTLTGCFSMREPAIDVAFRRGGQSPSVERSGPLLFHFSYVRQLENRIEIYCIEVEAPRHKESDRQIDRSHSPWMMRMTVPRLEETARPRLCRLQLLRVRESRSGSAHSQARESLVAYEGEAHLQFQFDCRIVETNLTDCRLESVRDADDVLFASGRVSGYRLSAKRPGDTWAANFEKIWATASDPPKETDDAP